MKTLSLVLACTFEGGIGLNNTIPWYIKSDLIKFKNITTKTDDDLKENAVIMGSKTYDSLPFKKLKNRINIVLTRNNRIKYLENDNIITFNDINDALKYCNNNKLIEKIFIIGGAYIYNTKTGEVYFCDSEECKKLDTPIEIFIEEKIEEDKGSKIPKKPKKESKIPKKPKKESKIPKPPKKKK